MDVMVDAAAGGRSKAELRPIDRADADRVGRFLHAHLNNRISARHWAEAITPGWEADAPNHGYMLVADNGVVGVQLAYYAQRQTSDGPARLCNIAAFCVHPDYRADSLRLLHAVLAQPGYSFTDLSPSGNVRQLNARLGFRELDTTAALVLNPTWLLTQTRAELLSDSQSMAAALAGADLRIYRDHHAAQAAHHLVLRQGERRCHVIFRRDRRKGLPLFATILYVSDRALFAEARGQVFRHLLLRHRIPFTLLELRLAQHRPALSMLLPGHRPKMFRSDHLGPQAIDYLYSELTCVAW